MSDDVLPRHGAHLIARHAEAMLWLARYMERIECLARLLDVTNTFARDEDDTRNWLSILRINLVVEVRHQRGLVVTGEHEAHDALPLAKLVMPWLSRCLRNTLNPW